MKKGTTKMAAKKTKKDIAPKLSILDPKIFYSQEDMVKDMLEHAGVKTIGEYNEKMKKVGKENAAKWKTYQNGLFSAVKSILMSTSNCPDTEKWGRRKCGILEEKISEVFKDAVKQNIINDPLVNVHVCEDGGINACVIWGVKTASYYSFTGNRRIHNNLTTFHLGSDGEVNVESRAIKNEKSISKDDEIDSNQMKHWTDIVEGLYSSKSDKKTKNK